MENRSRVEDIKNKFEQLNAAPVEKVPSTGKSAKPMLDKQTSLNENYRMPDKHKSISNFTNTKSIVKRSHAFRADKVCRNNAISQSDEERLHSVPVKPIVQDTVCASNFYVDSHSQLSNRSKHIEKKTIARNGLCTSNSVNKHNIPHLKLKSLSGEIQSPKCLITADKKYSFTHISNLNQKDHSIKEQPNQSECLSSFVNKSPIIPHKLKKDFDRNVTSASHCITKSVPQLRDDPTNISTQNLISKPNLPQNSQFPGDGSKLTAILTAALKAPLPQGPPPKKPPRTFAHVNKGNIGANLVKTIDSNELSSLCEKMTNLSKEKLCSLGSAKEVGVDSDQIRNNLGKPVRSKTESEIMLKKLETVLLNHQKGSVPIKKQSDDKNLSSLKQVLVPSKTNAVRNRSGPLPEVPVEGSKSQKNINANRNTGLCFDSLICATPESRISSDKNKYDSPFETRSNFFIDITQPSGSSFSLTNAIYISKNTSSELAVGVDHVYAEPTDTNRRPHFHVLKNSDERNLSVQKSGTPFVQANENAKENISIIPTKDQQHITGLHYMSIPIQEVNYKEQEKHFETAALLEPSLLTKPLSPAQRQSTIGSKLSFQRVEAVNTSLISALGKTRSGCEQEMADSVSGASGFTGTAPDIAGHMDKKNIQMLLNEAYGKCRQKPTTDGESDSDSLASTPDDGPPSRLEDTGAPVTILDREQLTAERKGYVRRVSSRAVSVCRSPNLSSDRFPHLFESLLLIGLDLNPERCKVPYIKMKYPHNVAVPAGIENLCFPDASDWPPVPSVKGDGQTYTLVLTNEAGDRKYGYCRRVQPEGAAICLPLAYCIITPFRANAFYNQVLEELESRHGQPENKTAILLRELYDSHFPAPGQGLSISISISPNAEQEPDFRSSVKKCEMLQRPLDQRREETDIVRLLSILRLSVFLQVIATLLLERKVILLSQSISTLSVCTEGLQSSLFPFQWQHTLVPIVPTEMMDLCQAPTPYLIGLLKSKSLDWRNLVPQHSIDEVLVVDVDESCVVHRVGDEATILPSRLSRGLRSALQLAFRDPNLSPTVTNMIASEALVRLFVELIGHYRLHITTVYETKRREFQREAFVKGIPSRSIQLFLEWFSETAMFNAFIESRLDRSPESRGLFEQRCAEFLEESDRSHQPFLKNYKAINKTVRNLGDRFKDWAAS